MSVLRLRVVAVVLLLVGVSIGGALPPRVAVATASPAVAGATNPVLGTYLSVTPVRILDTRDPQYGVLTGKLTDHSGGDFGVQGVPDVCRTLLLSVTATGATGSGYVDVDPRQGGSFTTSSLNFVAGQTVTNTVLMGRLPDQDFSVWNGSSGSVAVIIDVIGCFTGSLSLSPPLAGTSGGVNGVVPTRLLPATATAPGATLRLKVQGRAGVPAGAGAVGSVALVVTVTGPQRAGYLTAWAGGTAEPGTSNLNWSAGQTVASTVVVPVGADGTVALRNHSTGSVKILGDVNGYTVGGTVGAAGAVHSTQPVRIADSRSRQGFAGALPAHGVGSLAVVGHGGVPAGAQSVLLSVTEVGAQHPGYLTVYPNGTARPVVSDVSFGVSAPVATTVSSSLGADGRVAFYNGSAGSAHVVVDVLGWTMTGPAPLAQAGDAVTVDPMHSGLRAIGCNSDSTLCVLADPYGWTSTYDGHAWSQPVKSFPQLGTPRLGCVGARCVLVSSDGNSWTNDGSGWSPSTRLSDRSSTWTMSCHADGCAATNRVGEVWRWDGTSWRHGTDLPPTVNASGISCSGSFCLASTGHDIWASDGGDWSVTYHSTRGLYAIDCVSRTYCAVVTDHSVLFYDGSAWSEPIAAAAADFGVRTIACTSGSTCILVSVYGASAWDGHAWSTAVRFPGAATGLSSASCQSGAACTAVSTLGEVSTFDGSAWSGPTTVDREQGHGIQLSCADSQSCALIDRDGNAFTLTGSSWSALTHLSDHPLFRISCGAPGFCVAEDDLGSTFTFDGTRWSPAPTSPLSRFDLSCTAEGECRGLDATGRVSTLRDGAWSANTVQTGVHDGAISCTGTDYCMVAGDGEYVEGFTSWTPVRQSSALAGGVSSLSCGVAHHCVAGTFDGAATFTGTGWSYTPGLFEKDAYLGGAGLSCAGAGFCLSGYLSSVFDGTTWTRFGLSASDVSCWAERACLVASSYGAVTRLG